jgi:hypothetical protein
MVSMSCSRRARSGPYSPAVSAARTRCR